MSGVPSWRVTLVMAVSAGVVWSWLGGVAAPMTSVMVRAGADSGPVASVKRRVWSGGRA